MEKADRIMPKVVLDQLNEGPVATLAAKAFEMVAVFDEAVPTGMNHSVVVGRVAVSTVGRKRVLIAKRVRRIEKILRRYEICIFQNNEKSPKTFSCIPAESLAGTLTTA